VATADQIVQIAPLIRDHGPATLRKAIDPASKKTGSQRTTPRLVLSRRRIDSAEGVVTRTRDYALNKNERAMLVHYLRVAAARFDDDAQAGRADAAWRESMIKHSAEARALAARIENATYVRVGREVTR
jgi:hypothetical protein